MVHLPLLEKLSLKIKTENEKRVVWDIIRKKWVTLSPEEFVRQALIHYLTQDCGFPKSLISVEKQLQFGQLKKRYDLVVFDRQQRPWMLVECKAPEVNINENTLYQILQYHSQIPCPYWLLSNGVSSYCAKIDNQDIIWQTRLPNFNQ